MPGLKFERSGEARPRSYRTASEQMPRRGATGHLTIGDGRRYGRPVGGDPDPAEAIETFTDCDAATAVPLAGRPRATSTLVVASQRPPRDEAVRGERPQGCDGPRVRRELSTRQATTAHHAGVNSHSGCGVPGAADYHVTGAGLGSCRPPGATRSTRSHWNPRRRTRRPTVTRTELRRPEVGRRRAPSRSEPP